MQITMTVSRFGSEDGHKMAYFKSGETYDVAHTLAAYFISNGWAVDTEFHNKPRPSDSEILDSLFASLYPTRQQRQRFESAKPESEAV